MERVGHQTLETMSFAKWYNKWLYLLMRRFLGSEILEVGAGIGNFTQLLSDSGNVTATDIEKGYLDKLKKRLNGKVSVGFGDIEKGKYFFTNNKDRKFDSVVCLNVLEHVQKDNKSLKNIAGLIKKGGFIILLVPAHKFLYSDFDRDLGHFRRYTIGEIVKKLTIAGFNPIRVTYLNWWAAIGWLLFMKIMRKKQLPKSPVIIFDLFGKLFLLPEKYISPPFGLSVFSIAQKV